MYQTVMEALGASMLVLNLLDFYRLFNVHSGKNIPLNISGEGLYLFKNQCKFSSATACKIVEEGTKAASSMSSEEMTIPVVPKVIVDAVKVAFNPEDMLSKKEL